MEDKSELINSIIEPIKNDLNIEAGSDEEYILNSLFEDYDEE